MSTLNRIRIIGAVIATIILVIVIIQNTDTVQTRLLFATVEMPRALLLFITLAVGFALGLVTAVGIGRRKKD